MTPEHSLEPDVRTARREGRIKRLVIDELEVGVLRVRSIENLPAE